MNGEGDKSRILELYRYNQQRHQAVKVERQSYRIDWHYVAVLMVALIVYFAFYCAAIALTVYVAVAVARLMGAL